MFGTDANASTTWERAPFLVQPPTSNLQPPFSNRNTELLETLLTRWKQRTRPHSNRDIREHLRSLLGTLRPQRLCGASSPFRRLREANHRLRLLQPPRRRSLFASSSNLQLRTSRFQKTESSARTRTQLLIDHTRKLESTVTRRKQTTEVISNRYKLDPNRISESQAQRQRNAQKIRDFDSPTSNLQLPICATMDVAATHTTRGWSERAHGR